MLGTGKKGLADERTLGMTRVLIVVMVGCGTMAGPLYERDLGEWQYVGTDTYVLDGTRCARAGYTSGPVIDTRSMQTRLEARVCPIEDRTPAEALADVLERRVDIPGIDITQEQRGGHRYWHLDHGDGLEHVALWTSGKHVIVIEPPGLESIPFDVLDRYLDSHPSDVAPPTRDGRAVLPDDWMSEAPHVATLVGRERVLRFTENVDSHERSYFVVLRHREREPLVERVTELARRPDCDELTRRANFIHIECNAISVRLSRPDGRVATLEVDVRGATSVSGFLSTTDMTRRLSQLVESLGEPQAAEMEVTVRRERVLGIYYPMDGFEDPRWATIHRHVDALDDVGVSPQPGSAWIHLRETHRSPWDPERENARH